MKKRIVIFGLSLVPVLLIALAMATLRLPVLVMSEPDSLRRLPTELLFAAAENPLVRPWFDRVSQLLQDEPGLARYVQTHYLDAAGIAPQTSAEPGPFVLTFPHTANGSAGPGQASLVSSVLLLNNGGANAQGTVTLRQSDGSPLEVNTNMGRGSRFDFSLLSGEELRLVTDGSGSTQQGWVEVSSNVKLSGSGLFTVLDPQGKFISEVGIGDSPRANQLMVFVDTTDGKSTGVAISNPNAEGTANLTYTLRGLDGVQVAQAAPDQLEAGHQKAFFAAAAFPEANLTNFKGVMIVQSDLPIAVVTLRTRGLNFTSLPAVPEAVDTGEDEYALYFARIGDGVFGDQEFTTSIILLNNSDAAVAATVELFQADGSPLELALNGERGSSFDVEVPAGGAAELLSDGSTTPGVVGWIRVRSDQPLGGGATFVIKNSEGGFISEVGIASSLLDSKPSLVARVGEGVSTGFALTNVNDLDVVAKLRLVGNTISGASAAGQLSPEGETAPEIIAETTLNLGPKSHVGMFVSQVFPSVPAVQAQDFQGHMEIETYSPDFGENTLVPVTGLTLFLRSSGKGTFLTSTPLALHQVNFGPVTSFVPATLLAGSEPSFCLNTRQLAGELPLGKAVVTIDSASIDLSGIQDADIVGKAGSVILLFLLGSNTYMTEITPDSALFFSPVSLDGISESNPGWSRVSNLPGGGIRFEVLSNAFTEQPTDFSGLAQICFDAGLLQLPNTPGATLRVSEQYESQDIDPSDGGPLESTHFSRVSLAGLDNGAPRIDSMDALRVVGGQEVTLDGQFTPGAGNNQVTVEGGSRVNAEVVSASASQLRVRLPQNVASGPLRVESQGNTSNDYQLDVRFAPVSQVMFSGSPGEDANLHLELSQGRDQLLFMEAGLQPSQGEWITSGFSEGEKIGSMQVIAFDGSETELDLLVQAVEAGHLTLQAIEPGGEDPSFEIEISNQETPSFVLRMVNDLGFTVLAPIETRTVLDTTRPIFTRPNGSFDVMVTVTSQPERVFFPSTVLTVQQTHVQ